MHRPSTPRRGAVRLKALFDGIKRIHGKSVHFETFGEDCGWSDHHYGWLSQDGVSRLLREVDILVEPSEYQGFGLPGLEALASGICLVSSATKGVSEYGSHRVNCLIEGEVGLLELLDEAVQNRKLRRRLGGQARVDAMAFHWPAIAAMWKGELSRLYKESGRTLHSRSFD